MVLPKGILRWCFLVLAAGLAGCAAIQPFPHIARAGDTIILAVGSQTGMGKNNTQIWFYPDADPANPIDLNPGIRTFFRLYADRSSWAYSPNNADATTNFHYLHHEPWQTVVALDLPAGLPEGPGTVRIETTAPQPRPLDPGDPDVYPDLNTIDIRLEILPGVGSPNPLQYKTLYGGTLSGDLKELKPMRQALVEPPVEDPGAGWPTFAAVEFKLSLPMLDADGLTPTEKNLRVVPQDVSAFTDSRIQMTWSFDGSTLTVLFLSAGGNIRYYEPRFGAVAEYAYFTDVPILTSVRYFDIDGNEITGPAVADYTVALKGRQYWTP